VRQLDGTPASSRLEQVLALVSGSSQWKRSRAMRDLMGGPAGTTARWRIEDGKGEREVTLGYAAPQPPAEKRPQPVSELAPGIFYVDLTRAAMSAITPELDKLAAARGVVFDVRGYPTDAGYQILSHLIDAPETDRWMHVAKIVGPFGRTAGWDSHGWDLKPASPHLSAARVFLTDGRAISYAESVLGYVSDRKLGRVVGGPTAGTNGDIVSFLLPSGFSIAFTGMRVSGHDGKAPLHLVGVQPEVRVAPTIVGLRAGRDEVLERGFELLRTP
jgi:hypothetical protein